MKRILSAICILTFILTLLPSSLSLASAPTFTTLNGSWTAQNGTVTGGGDGNVFCMSDISVNGTDSWIFSADVTSVSGHGVGIVFGAPNPQNPNERWHSLMLLKNDGLGIMFRETNAKNDYITSRALTDAEKNSQTITLKLVCDKGKTITGYVNDNPVYTYTAEDYNGGYFGVVCCNAQATVTNFSFQEIVLPTLTSFSADLPFDVPFSPDETEYWVTTTDSTLTVNASSSAGTDITINNISKNSVKLNLNLGLNVCKVTASKGNLSNTYYLNIIRRRPQDSAYSDTYRQQLHYSNEMFSINDPNGLIYDAATGIYHLMFQSDYPLRGYKAQGDSKHWGHAVSRNLIDWEYVGVAIEPDENGVIWSGSGVIDKNNTSGLFDDTTPPESRMVFLYTYYGGKNGLGLCSIGLAYSTDHGQTFTKYDEVIIPNTGNMYGSGLRDPKVVWYEDETMKNGGKWVFIACGDNKTLLFSSDDLINWSFDSYVKDNTGRRHLATECPDLFPMEYEGETKWVLMASGAFYIIGELAPDKNSKMTFTSQSAKIYPVNGVKELWGPGSSDLFPEVYAAQTFYNTADGRRLQMNWIRDFASYGDKLWSNTISLPTELELVKINGEYRINYKPIDELAKKRADRLVDLENTVIKPGYNPLKDVKDTLLDITATVDPKNASKFGFRLHKGNGKYIEISYDATAGTVISDKTRTDAASAFKYETEINKQNDGSITMRIILDTHSVEAWFNDSVRHCGNAYITNMSTDCEFFCDQDVLVKSMTVYKLDPMDRNSISNPQTPTPTDTSVNTQTPDPTAPTAAPSNAPKLDGSSTTAILIIGGIILAAAAVTVIILVGKSKKKQ